MRSKRCVHSFAKLKHSGKSDKCPDDGFYEYAYAEQNNNEKKGQRLNDRENWHIYIKYTNLTRKSEREMEREEDRE